MKVFQELILILVHLDKEIIDLKVNVQDQEVQDELALEVIILGVREDLEITTHKVMILNLVKDDQEVLETDDLEVMILNQLKDNQDVREDLEIDDQDVREVQIVLKEQFLGTNPN